MSLQKYLLLFIICGIYTLTFTGQHVTELIWKKTENQWIWKSAYVGYITNVLYASTHRYHCSADFSICLSQTTKIIPDSSSSLLPQLSIKLSLCGHCGTRLWKWVWCRCFSWLTKQLHLQLTKVAEAQSAVLLILSDTDMPHYLHHFSFHAEKKVFTWLWAVLHPYCFHRNWEGKRQPGAAN